MSDGEKPSATLGSLFFTFLRIGVTAFGGGMASVAVFEKTVRDRGWLSPERTLEAVAVGQSLPGAIGANSITYTAMGLRGWPGAAVATFAFILPSFVLMVGFSIVYPYLRQMPAMDPVFEGFNAAVVGLILAVTMNLGQKTASTAGNFALAAFSCGALVLSGAAAAEVILLAGLIGIFVDSFRNGWRTNLNVPPGTACIIPWTLVSVAGLSVIGQIASVFLRAGAITFGGGYVMIPLLEHEVVGEARWLTHEEFADGMGFGQVAPGPIVKVATFIGYKAAGLTGATVATSAVYLPPFLISSLAGRYVNQFRSNRQVNAFLKGLSPAVLGMLLAAAISMGRAGIRGPTGAVIAVLGCAATLWLRTNPAWVVVAGGVVRPILKLWGV